MAEDGRELSAPGMTGSRGKPEETVRHHRFLKSPLSIFCAEEPCYNPDSHEPLVCGRIALPTGTREGAVLALGWWHGTCQEGKRLWETPVSMEGGKRISTEAHKTRW